MKLLQAATLLLASVKVIAQETCSDGEALVEISAVSKSIKEAEYSFHRYSFSLLDMTSNNVTAECVDCEFVSREIAGDIPESLTSYEAKACVPKDHCHRFLIGTTKERFESQRMIDDFESFTLHWDGESLLDNFNAYSFGRVDFGQCEPQCTSDQSEFEFFLSRNQMAYGNGLSWNLTGSDGAEIYAGTSPENSTSLVHIIECIPKDDCHKFEVGYPFGDVTFYSVRFDGIMFADGQLKAPYPDGNAFHLGVCATSEICNEGESLFEAQLNFKDSYSQNGTDGYALRNVEINWYVYDEDVDGFYENFFDDFDWYEFGQSYAVGRCLSSSKCSQFAINTKVIDFLESYVVSENGSELIERVVHGNYDFAKFADIYFIGKTTTGTSSCPADVWGGEPESTASLHIWSTFIGFAVFAMVALHL